MGTLFIIGGLVVLGLLAGSHSERKHIKSLDEREQEMQDFLLSDLKSFPGGVDTGLTPQLVIGEAAIATDYFKTMLAGFRNLIGGEVRSFETLQIRARREAVLRMMEQARAKGYNSVANLRLETADIGGNVITNRKSNSIVTSIIASGTAYRRPEA